MAHALLKVIHGGVIIRKKSIPLATSSKGNGSCRSHRARNILDAIENAASETATAWCSWRNLEPQSDGGTCSKKLSCLPETTTEVFFRCCFCAHVTVDQRGILKHLVVCGGEQLQCQQQCQKFSEIEDSTCHSGIHEQESTFESHLCPAAFWRNSQVVNRSQTYTGEKPSKSQKCSPAPAWNKPFKCTNCREAFFLSMDCITHIQTHTGETRYRRKQYYQDIGQSIKLLQHVRTHTVNKPFKCKLCLKDYSSRRNLTRHMGTHTGEGPYECELCPKSFSMRESLTFHMQTHT
ncbi:zinc finger protein 2 homolog [Ixodes scapularis]|uniref:zinc finger protein 2 homolog n=1 Tax=Ixodes scapularis TaxID=6945 RepID=UPI0011616A53|nr:zinc finger protein 2 homolog [Ixodes scapularis]